MRMREAVTGLRTLVEDREEVRLYLDGEIASSTVGGLASQALSQIGDH
jgi:hypothetical protein